MQNSSWDIVAFLKIKYDLSNYDLSGEAIDRITGSVSGVVSSRNAISDTGRFEYCMKGCHLNHSKDRPRYHGS